MSPVRPCWHYVYVLKNKKNSNFYVGVTGNLKERLEQHNKRLILSTKYLLPLQLVYFEGCLNKDDSYRRERYLKTGMGKRYLRNRIKGALQQAGTPQGGLTG